MARMRSNSDSETHDDYGSLSGEASQEPGRGYKAGTRPGAGEDKKPAAAGKGVARKPEEKNDNRYTASGNYGTEGNWNSDRGGDY